MKSKLPISLLCLFTLLFLVCCKHEPPPKVCQYDSSVEEMKKWYYFKTGTWWVYQEQNTGLLDTITVYYDWEGLSQSGYDGFEWFSISSLTGIDYRYRFNSSYSIHCLSERECTCHKVNRSKAQPGGFVGDEWLFLFPLIEGNYNNIDAYVGGEWIGGKTTCVETNLSAVVGNDTLVNVVRWNVDYDASMEGYPPSTYYLAENVGFIKMEYPSLNLKLIDYYVEQ